MMLQRTARGFGAAYENGVLIPSTPDPTSRPIVMNPTPGENFQIAASVVPTGTLSSSGLACNTAGGYTWDPSTAQCLQAGKTPQTPAAPTGMVVLTDPTTGIQTLAPSSQSQTQAVQNAVQQNNNPLTSAGIVATDGSSILETDYGPLPLWGWLAAAAALFLLVKK